MKSAEKSEFFTLSTEFSTGNRENFVENPVPQSATARILRKV